LKGNETVTLEVANWDTHELLTLSLKFLLEEQLGVTAALVGTSGGPAVYSRAGKGMVDINMEVWPLGKEAMQEKWLCSATKQRDCVVQDDVGYLGMSGVYVTARNESLLSHALDYWQSYTPAATGGLLGMLPPADFIRANATPCTEPHCSSDGRFYTSSCGGGSRGTGARLGNVTGCRLYLGGDPAWDAGIFEEAVDSFGSPLVATCVGFGALCACASAALGFPQPTSAACCAENAVPLLQPRAAHLRVRRLACADCRWRLVGVARRFRVHCGAGAGTVV